VTPATWPEDPLPELARLAATRPAVVLDDDPTGTQTLRDVHVLTHWDAGAVGRRLDEPAVFLSTNSRALEPDAAVAITGDAAAAALSAGRPVSLVSRSDSTLRGHFPAETLAIARAMDRPDARVLLAPFFGEGGRVTVDDVHLLERGGVRVPVADTEFARDAAFGYRSSNLRDWVAEKSRAAGRPLPPMTSLSLELVRSGGPSAVADALERLPPTGVAIANAEVDRDIEVVALGALLAEERGLPLIARSAASYVRARAGRPPAPLLARDDLRTDGPGIIVVGSHVPTTSAQLQALLASPLGSRIEAHEIHVASVLETAAEADAVVATAADHLDRALAAGRIGLVSTERDRRNVDLVGGQRISAALVGAVAGMQGRPGWVVAKGGITSFEIAARALGMREARVAGQLVPGVPAWIGETGTRWPGVPLIVFPGNVGDTGALRQVVGLLVGP
jgi:uncharacterized protein YgbK (DUF1537 family)